MIARCCRWRFMLVISGCTFALIKPEGDNVETAAKLWRKLTISRKAALRWEPMFPARPPRDLILFLRSAISSSLSFPVGAFFQPGMRVAHGLYQQTVVRITEQDGRTQFSSLRSTASREIET